MKRTLMCLAAALCATAVQADDLSRFIGYRIVAKKTIAGYVEEHGSARKSDTSFEGCDYDRKIIFTDNTYLTCRSYSYSYSYRPEAILLANGSQWVMIVNGNTYEMSN